MSCQITISLDGFAAGPNQTEADPMGEGAMRIHEWAFSESGSVDAKIREEALSGHGAYIMGRNMFGPVRGDWPDDSWRGWWGEDPPYHRPVFVLTHHEHEPLEMEGGTTFHFVTDGVEAALERAKAAAGDGDVHIAGGASTVQQYLRMGAIDELWLHIAPITLGAGERLLDGVGRLTLEPGEVVATALATHVRYRVLR